MSYLPCDKPEAAMSLCSEPRRPIRFRNKALIHVVAALEQAVVGV